MFRGIVKCVLRDVQRDMRPEQALWPNDTKMKKRQKEEISSWAQSWWLWSHIIPTSYGTGLGTSYGTGRSTVRKKNAIDLNENMHLIQEIFLQKASVFLQKIVSFPSENLLFSFRKVTAFLQENYCFSSKENIFFLDPVVYYLPGTGIATGTFLYTVTGTGLSNLIAIGRGTSIGTGRSTYTEINQLKYEFRSL